MSGVELHPQLRADCHVLGGFGATRVLLHRDGRLPWFILVPGTLAQNLLDLDEALLRAVMGQCRVVSAFITGELGYPRVNVASIGLLVPQLHVHVVGRRPGDACWPKPVWGHLVADPVPYPPGRVDELRRALMRRGLLADPAPEG